MSGIVGKENAEHYLWGGDCEGWRLVDRQELSVILERMPAGRAETRHFHETARQFFLVLSGELTFEVDDAAHVVSAGRGFEVAPATPHRVLNARAEAAEFLVVSHPTTRGDRFES